MQNELTITRNRPTLLRAEQSRVNCALFASCEAHETEYYIRDG